MMSKRNPIKENRKNGHKSSPALLGVRGSPFLSAKFENQSALYKFVYGSSISVTVVLLLILSFTVQGVHKVFADELPIALPAVEAPVVESDVTVTEVLENQIPDTESISDPVETDVVVEDKVSLPEEFLPSTSTATSTAEDTETIVIATTTDTTSSSTIAATTEPSDDGDLIPGPGDVDPITDSFLPDIIDEVITDETVVSSEVISVANNDSVFTFRKDQCTKLATGSVYCQEDNPNVLQDALFSAPDEDGDLEIFIVREGKQTQITNNKVDDAAPYYDINSNTIVWHRLVNDRYQIISYDLDEREETQLTNTSENNMEPTRQGKYTVWQRWIAGGWNIILNDGESESQITYSSNSSIAPYVHGSLVVWNKYSQTNEKVIEMYDIRTGTYVTIDDPDGMSVSNPRMVFVYDSLHPNGDIVTKGYDVLAKKFINLDTLPREIPTEIPTSESTGETRALIQSKPTLKSDGSDDVSTSTPIVNDPPETDVSDPLDLVDEYTLDMTASSTVEISSSTPTVINEITDFDIVIEPIITTATTTEDSV